MGVGGVGGGLATRYRFGVKVTVSPSLRCHSGSLLNAQHHMGLRAHSHRVLMCIAECIADEANSSNEPCGSVAIRRVTEVGSY